MSVAGSSWIDTSTMGGPKITTEESERSEVPVSVVEVPL